MKIIVEFCEFWVVFKFESGKFLCKVNIYYEEVFGSYLKRIRV